MLLAFGVALAQPTFQLPGPAVLTAGPDHSNVDLWRAAPGADKVHVLVTLPDGSEELFLLDTGASISALNRDVAERLHLTTEPLPGMIEGLAGAVPWEGAVIPSLRIGDMELSHLDVAVGVPGVPDSAGALPVAGILGNNVWANFTLVVDYPADTLELWRAGAYRGPKGSPMPVAELHPIASVRVRAKDGTRADVPLQVDTGAHDVLFLGDAGEPFRDASTVGVEPVLGIGASLDDLPPHSLLQTTRRVAVSRVKVGGRRVPLDLAARWLGADTDEPVHGGVPGLLGYASLGAYRVVLDFPNQRIALTKSKRPARAFDASAAWLEKERARHGDDPARAAIRARLQHVSGDEPGARATLDAAAKLLPEDAEIAGLRSWYLRRDGDFAGALDVLLAVPPASLAEEHAWIGTIDALVLEGRVEEAVKRANDALAALDEHNREELHVALADALLAAGKPAQAAAALDEGDGLSAHLLRRARIAAEDGDRYGAIETLRDLIKLYPLDGVPIWLYATLAAPDDVPTFLADLDTALARLHPGDEPWDFVGAALRAVGQPSRAAEALARGYTRDCVPIPASPTRANCDAWYWSLGGERLDDARARIAEAIAAEPGNSAWQDTAAMVAAFAGDEAAARDHALRAARLSPDDPYLLWQVHRTGAMISRREAP